MSLSNPELPVPDESELLQRHAAALAQSLAAAARSIPLADAAALRDAVAAVPTAFLGACRVEYVALEAGGEPGRAAEVSCGGKQVGWVRLAGDVADSPLIAPLLHGVAALVEATLQTLQRQQANSRYVEALTLDRVYFERLFESAPEAIVLLDAEDRVLRANREFERLFGYTEAEAEGRTTVELIVPADQHATARALTRSVAAGNQIHEETIRRRKDGSMVHVAVRGTPIIVGGSQVAVYGIYRDITVQKETEEALRRLSTTDELTGLYNRRGFFLLADQQRRVALRRRAELLLLYIDIDNFKSVNDTYGHQEGDQVLADLGQILRSCYRDSDIVARVNEEMNVLARMGGDEFVVLAVDAGEKSEEILTARLQERIDEYNRASGGRYQLSLSIGYVRVTPDPNITIDALLASADSRMYRNKRRRS